MDDPAEVEKKLRNWLDRFKQEKFKTLLIFLFILVLLVGIGYFTGIGNQWSEQKNPIPTIQTTSTTVSVGTNTGIIQTGANSNATQTVYPVASFSYSIISKSEKQGDGLYLTGFVLKVIHVPQVPVGTITANSILMRCLITPPGPHEANSGSDSLDALTGVVTFMRKLSCTSISPIIDNGTLFTYTEK